jgi:hypothetical protein
LLQKSEALAVLMLLPFQIFFQNTGLIIYSIFRLLWIEKKAREGAVIVHNPACLHIIVGLVMAID